MTNVERENLALTVELNFYLLLVKLVAFCVEKHDVQPSKYKCMLNTTQLDQVDIQVSTLIYKQQSNCAMDKRTIDQSFQYFHY